MRVELFNYGRYRYMLCGPSDLSPRERYETELDALAAGAKLFADRNERHWASQPEVVARIRTFIKESIPWHLSGMWEDNPREVVTCLCRCVLDGSVVILRAERASSYAARSKAHRDDLKAYNQAIDERIARAASALKPFRHVETIAEAGARNCAARAASALLTSVASAMPARNDAFDLGEVTDAGSRATPLGDAAPFEYSPSEPGGDLLSIAARGVSESHEAECFAKYEIDMDLCSAGGAMFQSPAYYMACKARAFANYQQCRGY